MKLIYFNLKNQHKVLQKLLLLLPILPPQEIISQKRNT